ncbi:unnamed protein product [Didymodactylos carnosus]|uniref:Uncharacterized protein n=1 Tax=Didymodactylos carnosus TaxID=1234261 RepID=A0A8S2F7C2_9BILA|nr:unnamed protein product [Didymodactylos carnosus]CAF4164033.1 unnamed protein product [Didymodactylos carnosus]
MRLLKRYSVWRCCGKGETLDTMIYLKDIEYIRQYNPKEKNCCQNVCSRLFCLCGTHPQAIELRGGFGTETLQLDRSEIGQACVDIPMAISNYKSHPLGQQP